MSTNNSTPLSQRELDRLLTLHDLVDRTGLSRATLYREISAGQFPAPLKVGRASRWSAAEVAAFIELRKAARDMETRAAGSPDGREPDSYEITGKLEG